jgi:hypothetical protein
MGYQTGVRPQVAHQLTQIVCVILLFLVPATSLPSAIAQMPDITVLPPGEVEDKAKMTWEALPDQTDSTLLDQFIEQFPNTDHAKVAFSIRYGLMKERKSIEEYNAFLEKYPDRLITPVALSEVFELYHDVNSGGGRILDYLDFIRLYPGTPESYLATLHVQELMYRNVVGRDNTLRRNASQILDEDELLSSYEQIINEYDAFLVAFPDAPQRECAIIRAKEANLDYEKQYVESERLRLRIKESVDPTLAPAHWRVNELVVVDYDDLISSLNKLNESQMLADGGIHQIRIDRIAHLVKNLYFPLESPAIATLFKEIWDEKRHTEVMAKLQEIVDGNNDLRKSVIKEIQESTNQIVKKINSESDLTRVAIGSLNKKLDTIHIDLVKVAGQIEETNSKLYLLHSDIQNVSKNIDKLSETMSAGLSSINVKLDTISDNLQKVARKHTSGSNRGPHFPPFAVPKIPSLKDIPDLPQIQLPRYCPPGVADSIHVVNAVFQGTNVVKDILSDPNEIARNPKAAMFRLLFEGSPVAWLERPNLISCNPNKLSEIPIFFVNGIRVTRQNAEDTASDLSRKANRPVMLLHNQTSLEGSTGTPGCGGHDSVGAGDLLESIYDRKWTPVELAQLNPATRQLAYLLYDHAKKGKPLTLVSHSQGCIISRNAIWMVRMLGKREWVESKLTWIAAANPLNGREIDDIKPSTKTHFKQINDHNDAVAKLLGLRKWVPPSWKNFGDNHDFTKKYAEHVAKALSSVD